MRIKSLLSATIVATLMMAAPVSAWPPMPPEVHADADNIKTDPVTLAADHFNGAIFFLDRKIGIYNLSHMHQTVSTPISMINRVRAHVGDDSIVWLMFTGMKPDSDGRFDVTYDLDVLAPDGTIYGTASYKNLRALSGKMFNPSVVWDNDATTIGILFDKHDKTGIYQFKAVLHDNIAKVDYPLATQVELLP